MATGGGAADLDMCPECLGPFTDPKFLPCHHTVCAPCIQNIAKRYSKRAFPCPACQKPTTLPRKGVRALQSNVYANSQTKGDAATTAAVQGDKERSSKASSSSPRLPNASETPSKASQISTKDPSHPGPSNASKTSSNSATTCQFHDEKLEYLCHDCDRMVCVVCTWLKAHRNHTTERQVSQQDLSAENDSDSSLEEEEAEMTVVKQFRCCTESNARVFSLYHTEFYLRNGLYFLYICFERSEGERGAKVETFYDNGIFVETNRRKQGEATMKVFSGKNLLHRMELDITDEARREAMLTHYFFDQWLYFRAELDRNKGAFAKSNNFGLERASREKARLVSYTFCSQHIHLIPKTNFTINVNRHRVVDVDDAADVVVVVEEPRTPDGRRNVLMYRRPDKNAVCVYTPPNAQDFQPADVCFFRINGEEVLLVADEASEDIHVAKIGRTTLTFDRFLHTDCPELQYPTALAVDAQGRLWVACKGGLIVALHEVASGKPAKKSLKSSRSTSFHFYAPLCAIGFVLIAVFIGLVFDVSTLMN